MSQSIAVELPKQLFATHSVERRVNSTHPRRGPNGSRFGFRIPTLLTLLKSEFISCIEVPHSRIDIDNFLAMFQNYFARNLLISISNRGN